MQKYTNTHPSFYVALLPPYCETFVKKRSAVTDSYISFKTKHASTNTFYIHTQVLLHDSHMHTQLFLTYIQNYYRLSSAFLSRRCRHTQILHTYIHKHSLHTYTSTTLSRETDPNISNKTMHAYTATTYIHTQVHTSTSYIHTQVPTTYIQNTGSHSSRPINMAHTKTRYSPRIPHSVVAPNGQTIYGLWFRHDQGVGYLRKQRFRGQYGGHV